jgi:hypothetical protein
VVRNPRLIRLGLRSTRSMSATAAARPRDSDFPGSDLVFYFQMFKHEFKSHRTNPAAEDSDDDDWPRAGSPPAGGLGV